MTGNATEAADENGDYLWIHGNAELGMRKWMTMLLTAKRMSQVPEVRMKAGQDTDRKKMAA